MTNFEKQMKKLLVAVKNRAGDKFGKIRVNCWGGVVDCLDVATAVKYMGEVDDVCGVNALDKDGNSLGWFGIESANYDCDIFDIVYDYSDNDFARSVMDVLR